MQVEGELASEPTKMNFLQLHLEAPCALNLRSVGKKSPVREPWYLTEWGSHCQLACMTDAQTACASAAMYGGHVHYVISAATSRNACSDSCSIDHAVGQPRGQHDMLQGLNCNASRRQAEGP